MTTWHGRISAWFTVAANSTSLPASSAEKEYIAENQLGSPNLIKYLKKQKLMDTHRLDISYAHYAIIDASSHIIQVIANEHPGRNIDDVVEAHEEATAIINGTWFSGDQPMQSLGCLRQNSVELPTSLPANSG